MYGCYQANFFLQHAEVLLKTGVALLQMFGNLYFTQDFMIKIDGFSKAFKPVGRRK